MKFIFSTILVLSSLVLSATAFANKTDTIEFLYYFPPGGGSDRYTAPLVDSLDKQGVNVKRTFFKTCADAVRYANQDPNGKIIVANSQDMHPVEAGRCPPQTESNLTWVSNIIVAPLYLCTVPNKNELTLEDLNSGERFNVGHVSAESTALLAQAFIKYNKEDLDLRLVPYEGGGELRIAGMSGRDLDFVITGNDAPVFIKEGSTCLASTVKNNYYDLPHLGDYVENFDFPDFGLDLSLWSTSSLNDAQFDALLAAFNSDEFTSFLNTRIGVQHQGIASSVKQTDSYDSIMNQISVLDFLRKTL